MAYCALITGVPGFLGSFLAEHLLDCGDAVMGSSRDGNWRPSSPSSLHERVELVPWDLSAPDGLWPATRHRIEAFEPNCIYHAAGLSVPEDCGRQEPVAHARAVNVDGTRRVMQLAASLPSRPRVLFASSGHVYAPVSHDAPLVDETAPLGPRRAYGRTKLAAEDEVRRAIDQDGCDAVIVRSFQHTGPRQNSRMMLPQWAKQFAAGGTQPVEVYTRDAQIDLTDGRDVVRAYRLLAQHGRPGEVYNVGAGVSLRSGDVLDVLRQLADPRRPVVELRPGFRQDPIADIGRLVRCTGWRATIALEQTVADTLAWWQEFLQQELQS